MCLQKKKKIRFLLMWRKIDDGTRLNESLRICIRCLGFQFGSRLDTRKFKASRCTSIVNSLPLSINVSLFYASSFTGFLSDDVYYPPLDSRRAAIYERLFNTIEINRIKKKKNRLVVEVSGRARVVRTCPLVNVRLRA